MNDFHLRIGRYRYRIVDRRRADDAEPVPMREVRRELTHYFADHGGLVDERIRRLCRALRIAPPSHEATDVDREVLLGRVLGRFESRVVLVREALPTWRRHEVEELPEEPVGDSEDLEWIEVQLIDEDDQPVAGVPYRIELSDKRVRTGVTNANGTLRYERIPGGTCKFTFTKLDEDAWEPV